MNHRAGFIPRNNLDSKNIPTFGSQALPSLTDQNSQLFTSPCISEDLSLHLPAHPRPWDSIASTREVGGEALSELGDSSSLFSFQSPPEFGSSSISPPHPRYQVSIPFKLGSSNKYEQYRRETQLESNMVNERSPAKAPLHPVMPNEQPPPPRGVEGAALPKHAQLATPQFGLPSMPQSPLYRPAQKESSVFIQPKSRPEHHRDTNNPGMALVNFRIKPLTFYRKSTHTILQRSR